MAYEDALPTALRVERARIKLTQQQVATATGITAASLCSYENGERMPTLQTLSRLADFYNTSLDKLMGRSK